VKAAATPAYELAALLRRAATLLVERADRLAAIMTRETGKAIKDAKAEILRSQDTLTLSAEEAVRIEGEHVPLDATAMGMLRFPVGVVAGITPFNAPVNLACHKIAPAIAAGNTLVLLGSGGCMTAPQRPMMRCPQVGVVVWRLSGENANQDEGHRETGCGGPS
jgi:acyl-CoA reductase-like NAD-dependent aldehyde dehydrogenase